MAAGANSIDDMDLLRHDAMPDLFGGIRAPSTLGSHLRSYRWGNVRQLETVNRELLGELAPAGAAAARQGHAGLRGHRRDANGSTGTISKAPRSACQDPGQELAGPRPERAGRDDQHAAGGAGDRRDEAARRERGSVPPLARALTTHGNDIKVLSDLG